MSSDTFRIHIQSIEGPVVELLCETGTAGGLNDYAVTRSFALMAIEDGMPYASADGGSPLRKALKEIGGETPPLWEEAFHRDHVGTFIKSTKLLWRKGIITDIPTWQEGHFDSTLPNEVISRDYPLHSFLLAVTMTDPAFLTGLSVGDRYGTTAFDAWWDDPTRPTNKQLASVETKASRWVSPKAAAANAEALAKKAAKKAAAKKAPAKKLP